MQSVFKKFNERLRLVKAVRTAFPANETFVYLGVNCDFYKLVLRHRFNHIAKFRFSTTPLFKVDNGIPKIQGTCSFIKFKNCFFLLTAEHVLNGHQDNLFYPKEKESKILLRPAGVSFLDHKNDIGIILLCEEAVKQIKDFYVFFEIIEKHYEETPNANFTFIGFPESKGRYNEYKSESKINIEPLIFTTEEASKEIIKNINMLNEDKIFIMYDKNKVYNIVDRKYKTGPDLYGISGCALIHHRFKEFFIYGILTDWSQKNRKVLIGTKFIYITKILNFAISKNYS